VTDYDVALFISESDYRAIAFFFFTPLFPRDKVPTWCLAGIKPPGFSTATRFRLSLALSRRARPYRYVVSHQTFVILQPDNCQELLSPGGNADLPLNGYDVSLTIGHQRANEPVSLLAAEIISM